MQIINENIVSASLEATNKIAQNLASTAKIGDVFTLKGTLGAGKTAFAKAFINELMQAPTEVISPTFNLLQTYDTPNAVVYHYDLYRIKNTNELYELAIDENFESSITLIEWPEIAENFLPKNSIKISIEFAADGIERIFKIKQ